MAVGPELQGDRDHLGAPLALEQGRNRRVDAPAERHQHPISSGRRLGEDHAGRCRRGHGAVKRVGGEVRGMAALDGEPAELLGDIAGSDPGRLQRLGPSTASVSAAPAAIVAEQPSAS